MITILVLLCLAVGCSSNKNLKTANKTTSINGDNLVVLTDEICNNFISDEDTIYGCGVGYSADITISKSKALSIYHHTQRKYNNQFNLLRPIRIKIFSKL